MAKASIQRATNRPQPKFEGRTHHNQRHDMQAALSVSTTSPRPPPPRPPQPLPSPQTASRRRSRPTGLLAGSATPVVPLADWRGDLDDKELHTPITLAEVHELLAEHGHRAAAIIRTRWNHGLRVLDKNSKA